MEDKDLSIKGFTEVHPGIVDDLCDALVGIGVSVDLGVTPYTLFYTVNANVDMNVLLSVLRSFSENRGVMLIISTYSKSINRLKILYTKPVECLKETMDFPYVVVIGG